MKSGVRGASFLARAHFLPNEYNNNPGGDIRLKIGISPNRRDGRGLQRRPLLSLPGLGAEGALPFPKDRPHVQLATASRSGTARSEHGLGVVQQRRAGSASPGSSLPSAGWKKTGLSRGPGGLRHRPARAFLTHRAGLRRRSSGSPPALLGWGARSI